MDAVWTRVESMLGEDVGKPLAVRIENLSTTNSLEPSQFEAILGVRPPESAPTVTGRTPGAAEGNVVELNSDVLDADTPLEDTLAHEFVHVVQLRTRAYRTVERELGGDRSPDKSIVYAAIMEGSARHVERGYEQRYLQSSNESRGDWYLEETTVAKRFAARYYFGARYVNATVDSLDELDTVYENPPQTSEELVHRLPPGSEPRAALSVRTDTDRRTVRSGPYGELYVRTLFGTELDEPAAAALADGWGNDTRVRFGSGNSSDYAWVLRWDDSSNATEFERGVQAYLDERNPSSSVRVERVAPETTVLFAGDESFVADASASGRNATVTVSA